MLAHVLLELVGLVFHPGHVLLELFDTLPILGDHRLEEGDQLGRAFVRLGHMLLHGADGRTPEQADEGVGWHRGDPV